MHKHKTQKIKSILCLNAVAPRPVAWLAEMSRQKTLSRARPLASWEYTYVGAKRRRVDQHSHLTCYCTKLTCANRNRGFWDDSGTSQNPVIFTTYNNRMQVLEYKPEARRRRSVCLWPGDSHIYPHPCPLLSAELEMLTTPWFAYAPNHLPAPPKPMLWTTVKHGAGRYLFKLRPRPPAWSAQRGDVGIPACSRMIPLIIDT